MANLGMVEARSKAESKHRYDAAMELAAKLGGLQRTTLHLACAIACVAPGCITYATATKSSTYKDLAITAALATVEIGGGVLGGYALSKDNEPDDGTFSPMLAVPGGFLVVDAIIALGVYLSHDD